MIAGDTSSIIAYLEGSKGNDVDAIEDALKSKILVLPPVVLTELLSDPKLPDKVYNILRLLPVLDTTEGYWERAGQSRAILLKQSLKCRVADALIAQTCIDYNIPLITRDNDFRHFEKLTALSVIK